MTARDLVEYINKNPQNGGDIVFSARLPVYDETDEFAFAKDKVIVTAALGRYEKSLLLDMQHLNHYALGALKAWHLEAHECIKALRKAAAQPYGALAHHFTVNPHFTPPPPSPKTPAR